MSASTLHGPMTTTPIATTPHTGSVPSDSAPLDVLVIGGGQAGLSLAWHLNRQGARYLLVDAAPALGRHGQHRPRPDALDLSHGPAVAQAVQLALEYDPQPPYDAGTPATAPAEIGELVSSYSAQRCS